MSEQTETKDIKKSNEESKPTEKRTDRCCYYVVDCCGCYVDPCCCC